MNPNCKLLNQGIVKCKYVNPDKHCTI